MKQLKMRFKRFISVLSACAIVSILAFMSTNSHPKTVVRQNQNKMEANTQNLKQPFSNDRPSGNLPFPAEGQEGSKNFSGGKSARFNLSSSENQQADSSMDTNHPPALDRSGSSSKANDTSTSSSDSAETSSGIAPTSTSYANAVKENIATDTAKISWLQSTFNQDQAFVNSASSDCKDYYQNALTEDQKELGSVQNDLTYWKSVANIIGLKQ